MSVSLTTAVVVLGVVAGLVAGVVNYMTIRASLLREAQYGRDEGIHQLD